MLYRWLAGGLVVVHLGFVVFVVLGGLLVLRWPRVAWVHLPSAAWGVFTEFAGVVCPLTPLENLLRARAAQPGYAAGFIEHYLIPVLYPAALTRPIQVTLGTLAVLLNVAIYWWVFRARRAAVRPG